MRDIDRRSALTTLVVGLSVAAPGCVANLDPAREAPDYDCSSADRPEPDDPRSGGSRTDEGDAGSEDEREPVGPKPYPDPPESVPDDESAVEYVTAYEEAYRRNALVERHGSNLVGHGNSVERTWTHDSPDDAAVVRLRYVYYEDVEDSGGTSHGDSPTTYVSYYVDDSMVVRAETEGQLDDEGALEPDPWSSGAVLECVEETA